LILKKSDLSNFKEKENIFALLKLLKMIDHIINVIKELDELVPKLLTHRPGNKLYILEGDLGSGKTTLVQAFGRYFNVSEQVLSPTFSIINEYSYIEEGKEKVFYHLDLYRLNSIEEALNIGIEEYLYSGAYCFIEWPEIIEDLLPKDLVKIKIEILSDSSRKVIVL